MGSGFNFDKADNGVLMVIENGDDRFVADVARTFVKLQGAYRTFALRVVLSHADEGQEVPAKRIGGLGVSSRKTTHNEEVSVLVHCLR